MAKGLDKTLFGRMHEVFGDEISSLLAIQYRMNSIIMGWSSKNFYESRLEAADMVAGQLLFEPQLAIAGADAREGDADDYAAAPKTEREKA